MVTRRASVAKRATADKPTARTSGQQAPQTSADRCGLSVRAARCIDIYLATFNAGQAYVEAGYTAKTPDVANANASRLIASDKGRAYLSKRAKAMFDRAELEQDRALMLLRLVAFGDARELVEFRRYACRYCYGKSFRYQYTAGEWDRAITQHEEKRQKLIDQGRPDPGSLDPKGGVGYDGLKEPNQQCPECFGEGIGRTIIKDTRHLSPSGIALYAGVKEGKDGIEIKALDRMRALELLAKILKLTDEAPKVTVAVDVAKLDADYSEIMRKAHAQAEQLRRERFGDCAQGGGAA